MGEAAGWYAARGPGLGTAFLDETTRVLQVLAESPEHYPIVEDSIRKAILHRFPYVILYRSTNEEVVVISCFHTRRNPREWRRRL